MKFPIHLKKSYSRRFLFAILLIVIGSLYIMKSKFVPTGLIFNIPDNQSSVIGIRCIVHAKKNLGRLGNRMFFVASAYGLARLHSCHLYLAPEIIEEMKNVFTFNLFLLISSSTFHSITMNTISKEIGCQYLPELTRPNAIAKGMIFELHGYWQSYLHFERYANELREDIFVSNRMVLKKVSRVFLKLHQQKFGNTSHFSSEDYHLFKKQLTRSTWIGIHIRRGDFVDLKFSSDNEYLFAAMNYYLSLYPHAHFLVATDDRSYCENLFRNQSNIFFTPKSFSPSDDLVALTLCQHSIITGGTFGWWAAYLANGQVIHDRVYPSGCERREYYYPPWFMIDGKVRAYKNSEYVL